ncbi:bifunctional metallophosphatase/5'-nucleotidase [Clostridium sp. B9]|uniref:bifunctional metallophosphatase/5'-nucleotidase n=1 Tax=Clostridium sp. B9 TaxID=3423224 RepID=UPI003D2F265F
MKKIIKTLSLVTITFLSLNLCVFNGVDVQGKEISDERKITILGTSDIHGRFVPWEYAADTENKAGSLSQISTIVKEERAKNPNTILVDAGDSIQDNYVENFNKGPKQPIVLGMNKMKYDVWEMGNHEFNFGLDVLKHVTDQFEGKVLAGNIYNEDGTRFMDGYTIIERDGVNIGIIGMDTPMVKKFEKPHNIEGLEFRNPVDETKKAIKELEGKVDAIIGVMHMGVDNENAIPDTGLTDIANQCPELTAIIGGHMHKLVKNQVINGVLITEPGKYGRAVSKIDLTFKNKNGKNVLENKEATTISVANVESDKEIENLLNPYHEELRKDANTVIGKLEGVNMVDENYIKGIPTIHIEDTPLINFFHEVGQYYSKADVIALAIDNDKAKLDVGEIKKKDIAYNYRYTGGEVSVYKVTGKDLKTYMEWAAGYFNTLKLGDITPSFNPERRASKYSTNDMFGGVTYNIDLREEEGNRIKNLKYKDGRTVNDTDILTLGMNSYRLGQLQGAGGIFQGKNFEKIWDSKTAYGEEAGTIRNLAIDYVKNVKHGLIKSQKQNNWSLLGIDPKSDNYKRVRELVNSGFLAIPSSKDGKYTNIASINEKDLPIEEVNEKVEPNEKNELNKEPIINEDVISNPDDKNNTSNLDKDTNKTSSDDAKAPNEVLDNKIKEDNSIKENNSQDNDGKVEEKLENKTVVELPRTGGALDGGILAQIASLLVVAGIIIKKR